MASAKAEPAVAPAGQDSAPKPVPKHFLSGPPPNPVRKDVIWEDTKLPEYGGLYATVLEGILTPAECEQFITHAQTQTGASWERALINIGNGQQAHYPDARNCDRIIWDSEDIVARIWGRCEALVPELKRVENWAEVTGLGPAKRGEVWKVKALNERMRILKYGKGEFFRLHQDGCYETPDKSARSMFTLHLYLNDAEHQPTGSIEPLVGGATTYWSIDEKRRLDVAPKIGSVLIFQQRMLLHAGDDVLSGTKITMRTDIMYEKTDEIGTKWQPPKVDQREKKSRYPWLSRKKEQA